MATTMISGDGKRRACTIEEKAQRLLANIRDVHETGLLAVVSDSDRTKAYAVYHDGHGNVTDCACTHCRSQKNPSPCSYRLAVAIYLAAMTAEETFYICPSCYGKTKRPHGLCGKCLYF